MVWLTSDMERKMLHDDELDEGIQYAFCEVGTRCDGGMLLPKDLSTGVSAGVWAVLESVGLVILFTLPRRL